LDTEQKVKEEGAAKLEQKWIATEKQARDEAATVKLKEQDSLAAEQKAKLEATAKAEAQKEQDMLAAARKAMMEAEAKLNQQQE